MTAEEQILGVLNVVKHAKDVSVSDKHLMIERDKFEQYPDYDTILDKLDLELNLITVNSRPKMSDVDYGANVGFMDEDILRAGISYTISPQLGFDEAFTKLNGEAKQKSATQPKVRITFVDGYITITHPNGSELKKWHLKIDLAPYNFMSYMIAHPNRDIPRAVIQTEVYMCSTKQDMTELVRGCGFNKQLKPIFFPSTTKTSVKFVPDVELSDKIAEQLFS